MVLISLRKNHTPGALGGGGFHMIPHWDGNDLFNGYKLHQLLFGPPPTSPPAPCTLCVFCWRSVPHALYLPFCSFFIYIMGGLDNGCVQGEGDNLCVYSYLGRIQWGSGAHRLCWRPTYFMYSFYTWNVLRPRAGLFRVPTIGRKEAAWDTFPEGNLNEIFQPLCFVDCF